MNKTMAGITLAATLASLPAGAQAQDARQEGPTEIEKCQTISQPGSYKLVNDLTFKGTTGTCLTIASSSVTIDLAGFAITGLGLTGSFPAGTAVAAGNDTKGITVRNGSISGFPVGVDLGGAGSIVEGLRVIGSRCPCALGISASGIVRGNTVVGIFGAALEGVGISASGIVSGNYVAFSREANYEIGQGSTVISNTAIGNAVTSAGIEVSCPSNVTDNTTTGSSPNLVLNGTGCNDTNNVAP